MTRLYLLVLLFHAILVYGQSTENCDSPWNITIDGNHLRWSGTERAADVVIHVEYDTVNGTGVECLPETLNVPFSEREAFIESTCKNTIYLVNATIACNGLKAKEIILQFEGAGKEAYASVPGAPTNITVVKITSTSITLQWDMPESPIAPVIGYDVHKSLNNDVNSGDIYPTVDTTHELAGLHPYTDYYIHVRTRHDSAKNGPWSSPLIVRTSPGVPHPPMGVAGESATDTSILITWKQPDASVGPILNYTIKWVEYESSAPPKTMEIKETSYRIEGLNAYTNYSVQVRAKTKAGPGPWSLPVVVTTEIGDNNQILWDPSYGLPKLVSKTMEIKETSYRIEGLNACTNYSVQVRAKTKAGSGPWSLPVVVTTEIGVPSIPKEITVTNTSSVSIALSWKPPDPANGPILDYNVYWGKRDSMTPVDVTDLQFEAKNLYPYTEYLFQVAARTKAGLGLFSELLYAWTEIDLPSQPRNLNHLEVTNTSIVVEWEAPELPNGPLLPYVVKVKYNGSEMMEVESNFTKCTMGGLLPYTDYVVLVCAQTRAGRGEWTEELEFRTEIGIPSPPQNVSPTRVLPTRISLSWDIPASPAGPSVDYTVEWGVQGTPPSQLNTTETAYEAIGLRPFTKYSFEVSARTEVGRGLAESVIVRTDSTAPSVPGEILEVDTTDSTIYVSWAQPEHPNGPGLLFFVIVAELSGKLTSSANSTKNTNYLIEGLKSSTNYSVQIYAQNLVGQGPLTEKKYITTNPKEPLKHLPLILGLVLGLALPLIIFVIAGVVIVIRKGGLFYLRSKFSTKTNQKQPGEQHNNSNPPVQLGVYHLTPKSLTVHNFEERIKHPMYSSRVAIVQEFGDLKEDSPLHSSDVAKMEGNLAKNRWGKMLPYDHSRVKILSAGDKIRPDFINANYIPGDSYMLEYIASQGPLKETLDDFWTMIWQQSVSVIVMLTQCVEKAVRNCEQYWPQSGQTRAFGEVQVHTQSEAVLASYVVRVLAVGNNYQKRQVIHMHFANWPVSGSPRNPDEFLHFVKTVREQTAEWKPGPILVHCSAGVGRTGTFIAVDRLLQHLKHSDDIDVYGTVLDMRRYRPHMVHTEDQYTFIYSCIQRFLQERKASQEPLYEVAL